LSSKYAAAIARARMRPEFHHLIDVMWELGWKTGRPTDTGLPRVFFKEVEGTRYEVKRSPQSTWRVRKKLPDLYVGRYIFPQWGWVLPEAFDTAAGAALWFDRVVQPMVKLKLRMK